MQTSKRAFLLVLGLLLVATSARAQTPTASPSAGRPFVAFGPQTFVRVAGPPQSLTGTFTVRNPNTSYTLRINNGGVNGELGHISSATVSLNGTQVAGPSDFNQQVTVIEKP